MATNYNIQMKRFNGVDWDSLYPKTSWANVSDKPAWIGANKPSYNTGEIYDSYFDDTLDSILYNFDSAFSTKIPKDSVVTKTANYTLVSTDWWNTIIFNSASSLTLTIPANSSVAFPIGTEVTVIRRGSGDVTIAINSDTLLSEGSKRKINAQYQGVILKKIATTTWVIIGALKS